MGVCDSCDRGKEKGGSSRDSKQAGDSAGPEWPSGLVACSPRRRPGFASRSVGLSEINFSDLYCGWLGRNISVEYNTIQHNTTVTGAWWCRGMFGALQLDGCGFESTSKPPRRDPGQVLHSQLLMRFCVKLRFSVRAVVGSASEWEISEGRYNKCSNTIQYRAGAIRSSSHGYGS